MNIINLQDKNLFYIGGVVRDEILGLPSFDTDITYIGNAIEFVKGLSDVQILQVNEPFGTVRVSLNGQEVDIASTRNETYPHKGHLPQVCNIGCSLKEDVLRRDFTINALAKSTLTGEIVDYTSGLADIKAKKLRVLHDNSFVDDPTRIVRGLKFSVRFGFDLDEHTKHLQEVYLKNINYDMSYKRLKKELVETFNLNSWKAFEIFVNQYIYKLIAPQDFELPKVNLEEIIKLYPVKNPWIIYVGLLSDISSLPLTKVEKKIVEDYQKIKTMKFHNDFTICKAFCGLNLETILMYSTVDEIVVKRYLDILQKIKIEITGKDLQNLGIQPSAKYQECFDYILKKKLENFSIDKAQELQFVREFFS
jgi:hypothetical protein